LPSERFAKDLTEVFEGVIDRLDVPTSMVNSQVDYFVESEILPNPDESLLGCAIAAKPKLKTASETDDWPWTLTKVIGMDAFSGYLSRVAPPIIEL
jgi:hypothetical protein